MLSSSTEVEYHVPSRTTHPNLSHWKNLGIVTQPFYKRMQKDETFKKGMCDCMDLMLLDASGMDKDAVCNLWKTPAEEMHRDAYSSGLRLGILHQRTILCLQNSAQSNPEALLKRTKKKV